MAFFTSSNPHFFKIILHHNLNQGKLDLPQKFVDDNGGGSVLYNNATLRLPDGAKWEVQLEISNGKVSFARGWLEFVNFYSIKVGYFVVFKLDESWCFDVVIFDLSATEIDYPIKMRTFCRMRIDNDRGFDGRAPNFAVKIESEDDDDDDGVKMLDEKDQEAARLIRKMKRKMMRKNRKRLTMSQQISDDEDEDEDHEMNYSWRKNNFRGSSSHYGDDNGAFNEESMRPMRPPKIPKPLTKNQEQVLRIASSFKLSTRNPSFMVTMRPSYIQTGNVLSLPRFFAEKHLKESMDVKLKLDDGRIWNVWCGVRWAFTRRRTELKGGWKRFAVDNELQDGDVCVFELINKVPKVFFRVTIFRLPHN